MEWTSASNNVCMLIKAGSPAEQLYSDKLRYLNSFIYPVEGLTEHVRAPNYM